MNLWTGCYFPFSDLYESVKQLWIADIHWPSSWPVRFQLSHINLIFCHCLYSRMLTIPQSLISPPQLSKPPHHSTTHPVFPFTAVFHTASHFPKSELNTSELLGSGPLRLSVRHQSRGSKGSTSVTLRNTSDEKKLISSAGSQPPSAVWRPKPMGSPAGWRLQKQSEPNDSAKLGACEMTLCSNLKGQRCNALKRLKNALSELGRVFTPSLLCKSRKYAAQVVLLGCC